MIVCPQCGFPVLEDNQVIAETQFTCGKCSWSGPSKDLILVPSHSDDAEFHKKIMELYFWISSSFGPRLAKKLYELRLVRQPKVTDPTRMDKEDKDIIRFAALVLQAAARGAFKGVIEAITEEVAGGEQTRRTVH